MRTSIKNTIMAAAIGTLASFPALAASMHQSGQDSSPATHAKHDSMSMMDCMGHADKSSMRSDSGRIHNEQQSSSSRLVPFQKWWDSSR